MADNYIYFFTHSTGLSTEAPLTEKLQDLSHTAATNPPRGSKGRCLSSDLGAVLECVVSENHICLLLEGGQLCRIRYNEEQPKEKREEATPPEASRSVSPRSELEDVARVPSNSLSWGVVLGEGGGALGAGSSYASGVSRLASRSRMLLRRRGGGRGVGSRWPLVPAADVPDSLINQAMAVLQGKSRDAVIRELQRTNLDVNQAVNNLLSRDDDDGGEGEGGEGDPLIPAAFFPSGDELLSLLGSVGAVGGEEEIEEGGRPTREGRDESSMREEIAGRLSRAVLDELGNEPLLVPRGVLGVREGEGGGGGRREEGKKRKSGAGKTNKKEAIPMPVFSDMESPSNKSLPCFKHIAALYSELVAVDTDGSLWRWTWKSSCVEPHPLVSDLGLTDEHVKLLSGRQLRVSVVTESGKVASWLDPSVSSVTPVVEQAAHAPSELVGETVTQLHSSQLFSVILTASNKIYWWGMFPFSERKQAVMDVQERLRGTSSRYSETEVQQNSLVCLRSSPIYTAGTKAIYCKGHKLQCGILQESVFSSSMTEKCRFRVVTAKQEPGDPVEVTGHIGEPEGATGGQQEAGQGDTAAGGPGGDDDTTPLSPQLGMKRRYHDDGVGCREELWSLQDVIFTDRVQSVRVGRVVKIDGLFAAVHFPVRCEGGRGEEEEEAMEEGEEGGMLDRCRLLRKDDLVLATDSLTQQVPNYRQDNLHRLRGPAPSDVAMVIFCGAQGVHALFSSHHQLLHVTLTLSGRVSLGSVFSQLSSYYFLHQATPTQLVPVATNQWLIRDKLGGAHLTSVNAASAMKDPSPLNLPPVTAMATGQCSSRTAVVVVAWQHQRLIPVLLRKDMTALKSLLASSERDELEPLLLEHTSGGCNILHVLSFLGRPRVPSRSPSPFSVAGGLERRGMAARTTPRSGMLREIMKQAMALASSSGPAAGLDPPDSTPWASDEGESDSSPPPLPPGGLPSGGPPSVISVCLAQLSLSPSILTALLTERNIEGHTPFMAAVTYKAYSVAMQLLDLAVSTADGDQTRLLAALYPSDCHPDDNPVFVLCRNDNCSFTWTGEMHIHQDIFICRSCGLTDSLCCCTECAYSCHRGHDCVFKKASPTAYCDCWERCSCRCLAQTPDSIRLSLLQKLMATTNLTDKLDSSHQSVLAVVLAMVTHQYQAQSHWSRIRSASLHSRSRHDDMPVHNLRPPRFAPKALTVLVEDWQCVKAAILCGSVGGASSDHTHQLGGVPMDTMVYQLLAKHSEQETLSALLTTLVRRITQGNHDNEAVGVVSCFLRSVIRVWSVCELENSHVPPLPSSRRPSVPQSVVSERAFFVFSSLAPHAIPALLTTAIAVITPVTRGMARPVDPLAVTDRHKVAEEMFRLPPVSLLREHSMETVDQGVGVSCDESEAGDGEEESVTGTVAQDASSTATIGSNLLYLSDEQDSSDNEELDSADDASVPGDYRHDDDVILEHPPPQRVRLSGGGSHWALPSLPPPPATPSSSGSRSRFSRSSRRSGRSTGSSAPLLAQTFSLIVRQIAVVLETTFDIRDCSVPSFQLPVSMSDPETLTKEVWSHLDPVWAWLATNLDSVEVLIRQGNEVSQQAPFRTHGRGKIGETGSCDALEGRRETLSYLLSLLREGGPETAGLIPAIDVAGMEHLAWTLDALHYLLETTRPLIEATPTSESPCSPPDSLPRSETYLFFRRSRSTSCLGSLPASPFDPLHEALPLAEKPHLLDSSYSKQHLFGFDRSAVLEMWPSCDLPAPPILPLLSHPLPRGQRTTVGKSKQPDSAPLRGCQVMGVNSHELATSVLLGRWSATVDLFGRVFGEVVGRMPGSFLAQERGFETREREFRREMEALHSSTHSELLLQVERSRDKLFLGVLQQLQSMYDNYHGTPGSTSLPPLCVYRIKVQFDNEPGEGSGVLRSLFTAFSDAILSQDPLPRLEGLARPRKTSLNYSTAGFKGKSSRDRAKACRSGPSLNVVPASVIRQTGRISDVEPPLFYQPGKVGLYSLVQATPTPERLQAFRGVGRMIGLSLLLAEVFPLPLCRHVLKFIMMKPVAWHDLAFFDPSMYESLRKLMLESKGPGGKERLEHMGLTFQVSLRAEEGGGEAIELLPGGAVHSVTPNNVYQYVKLYSELRMLRACQDSLLSLRQGVYDVIPEDCLSSLSAEDLRLVLCGCFSIDTEKLRLITVFEDESKKEEEMLTRFKVWFWSVVERMSSRERQDLLYFWTSSPALPANTESYQPSPSITIRPPDDSRLPTANTCISRLYLPLYSSRSLLKTRLLTALKTKTFGFV